MDYNFEDENRYPIPPDIRLKSTFKGITGIEWLIFGAVALIVIALMAIFGFGLLWLLVFPLAVLFCCYRNDDHYPERNLWQSAYRLWRYYTTPQRYSQIQIEMPAKASKKKGR